MPSCVMRERLRDFNPRFPRGKRQHFTYAHSSIKKFQSTLPAREATSSVWAGEISIWIFQSTLPAREATICRSAIIKITRYFNPRFPRGKRPHHPHRGGRIYNFNPRFPRGKRQTTPTVLVGVSSFQSTLPAREATPMRPPRAATEAHFNPRFPRGKRPGRA